VRAAVGVTLEDRRRRPSPRVVPTLRKNEWMEIGVYTDEGQITLDLARAPGTISVRTAYGDIDHTVPRGTYAHCKVCPDPSR
jgi:hypothetical protein